MAVRAEWPGGLRFMMTGRLFLLIFVGDYTVPQHRDELSAQKAIVKDHFKDCGWECEAILSELEGSTGSLFRQR